MAVLLSPSEAKTQTLGHEVEAKPGHTLPEISRWCKDSARAGFFAYTANIRTKGHTLRFSDPDTAFHAKTRFG